MAGSSLFNELAGLQDQLRGLWRFKWQALVVAWVVALLAWTAVFLIPNRYQAKAEVFVDTGTTLSQATKGIGLSDNVDQQLQRVSDALLSTPQLRQVATETNLMTGAISAQQQQAVVDNLRENINLIPYVDPKHPDATPTLFTITYEDPSRERAIQVVDQLLNDFVEGSLTDKSHGSQQAVQFLRQQIAAYGRRLSATEQQLALFKRRNIGLVPGEQGDAFAQLQGDNTQLRGLEGNLYVAERKRDALAQELHTGQPFTTSGASASAALPSGAALDTEQQIAQDQQRLDQLLLQYTDRYPDVIALKQTIKELKARRKRQLAAARKGSVGAASALGLTANPVYQQLEERYDAERVEVASIEQEISDLKRQMSSLKAKMGAAPQVDAEYAQLTRNYDVTKKQYDALLARLDSTRLGAQAASTGLVDFQVIDPPTAKYTPVSPKRPLLIIGTLLLAIGAGAGAAYLLHLLRPVFVSARQLGAVTGLAVLGTVSMAWAGEHRVAAHRGNLRYAWWAGGLIVAAVAVLLLQAHISNMVVELL